MFRFCDDDNRTNMDFVIQRCKGRTLVPFIGAGLTAGYFKGKDWTGFLRNYPSPYRKKVNEILDQAQNQYRYEEAVSLLKEKEANFNSVIRDTYAKIPDDFFPTTALTGITDIFDGPIMTTNFDFVIEKVYEMAGNPVKYGDYRHDTILHNALVNNEHYLIKLHGTIDDTQNIIFSNEKYNAVYGNNCIDYRLPIPELLKRVFQDRQILFIGCSLCVDRIMQILSDIKKSNPNILHFAIMGCEKTEEETLMTRERLNTYGISPIWYENKEYGQIAVLLQKIAGELPDRESNGPSVSGENNQSLPLCFEHSIMQHMQKELEKFKNMDVYVETPQILQILLTFPNSICKRMLNKYARHEYQPYGDFLLNLCTKHTLQKLNNNVTYDSCYDFFDVNTTPYLLVADKLRELFGDKHITEKHISYALLNTDKKTIREIHKSLGEPLMTTIKDALLKDQTLSGGLL